MYHRIKNTLAGLAVASAILGLSWTVGQPPTEPGLYAQPAIEGLEANAVEAVEEVAPATRRHHRGRASLSMPYFSFAQSLRPRG